MKWQINFFVFVMLMLLFFPQSHAQFLDEEKTISIDLKDAELKDVLKIFSIQSGMNFIASEGVEDRTITVYLDKVPIQEAMDKLFMANNLSYDLDKGSNTFIVKDWGKPEVETIIKVFYLKYATVSTSSLKEEMATIFKSTQAFRVEQGEEVVESGKWKTAEVAGITEIVKGLLTQYGKVIEDFRTNSLIVREIPSHMPVIAQVIAALDVSVPQVLLEVEILDVSKNAVDALGIKFPTSLAQLDMTTSARMTKFPFGNKGTSGRGWSMVREDPTVGGWKVDAWPASKFGPTILSVINTQLAFDFLRTQTDTKYLARPRILTLNNEPAEIKIVTQEAIGIKTSTSAAEGVGTSTEEAERVETGISLRVTPQINVDTGEITMFIYPTVSDASDGGIFPTAAGPTITFKDPEIRSTKCLARVKDAETIVVGGLIRNESAEERTKVPILGEIPFLGALFRHKNKSKGKERELLVFITPHIIKDSGMGADKIAKTRLPEREQETTSGINRQEAINTNLNIFEKSNY